MVLKCSATIDDDSKRENFIEGLRNMGYFPETKGNKVRVMVKGGVLASSLRLLAKFEELPYVAEINYRRD